MNTLLHYLLSFMVACGIIIVMLSIVLLPVYFAGSAVIPYFFIAGFVIVIVGLTRLIYRDFFKS